MSSDLAIRARGVTKRYRIRTDGSPDSVLHRAGRQTFTALDGVDLDVARGAVVGIIGRNGSGKSTLLKICSRVTAPTEGVIDIWGRVGTLLEVGTGFHNELTGRENVYLNGAILGMQRRTIDREFSNIVDFADIGPFLDTPVKRYSSGMRVRLAFSVAAHLNPDILFVDEVLAVGDAEFQSRCIRKMSDVAGNEGRTVVFVSHDMAAVEHLCSVVCVLDQGRVTFQGSAPDAIAHYLASGAAGGLHEGPGVFNITHAKHLRRLTTTDGHRPVDQFITGQALKISIDLADFNRVRQPFLGVTIRTPNEQTVFAATTRMRPLDWSERSEDGYERVELEIPCLTLLPGHYWVGVGIVDRADARQIENVARAGELTVVAGGNVYGTGYQPRAADGLVYVEHDWRRRPAESRDANAQPGGAIAR